MWISAGMELLGALRCRQDSLADVRQLLNDITRYCHAGCVQEIQQECGQAGDATTASAARGNSQRSYATPDRSKISTNPLT
jgi:hypothetical protein